MLRFIYTDGNPTPMVISDAFGGPDQDYYNEPCEECIEDGEDECQGHPAVEDE